MAKEKTFFDILESKGLLKRTEIDFIAKEAKDKNIDPEELLIDKYRFSAIEIAKAKSELTGAPFKVIRAEIPFDVLQLISEEAARRYRFIPLAKTDNILEVGMINPEDVKAQEALKFIILRSGLTPKIYIVSRSDFEDVLKQYRGLKGEVKKALKEYTKEAAEEEIILPKSPLIENLERMAVEAPITKIVSVILRHAVEGNASDVHVEPTDKQLRVRFRVDGILYTSLLLPVEIHSAVVSRIKILSNLQIDETRKPQDGRFHTVVEDKEVDFRVSTFPTSFGEKVAMRILDPTVGLKSFSDLGLLGRNAEVLFEGLKRPFGLILLTGPTGSGKSTTLYAILQFLNKETVNIVSLEDPIEYFLAGVNQSQIKPEIGYDFATGLRHILRGDPDVIMVGEIRDRETAALAVHAALTGHLVLSTLHTNDAFGVIPRLIDLGVEPFLIPSTLTIAMAQRLIRRLCPESRQETEVDPEKSLMIEKTLADLPKEIKESVKIKKGAKVYRPLVSPTCPKGTRGRIGIYEVLRMTPGLEKIILEEPSEARLKEEAKKQGMVSMYADGLLKALEGVISFEELQQTAQTPDAE
ncbi:MAG: type II/IV secretion system protein [Parcubacteria group bacterium]|nr:type II/IV secretion system protein [Parcubacteria group bacterium]